MNTIINIQERFTLALIHSSNCKEGCKLHDWLSTNDHCSWDRVTCNSDSAVNGLKLYDAGLSKQFTLFELDELRQMTLQTNNLTGTFTIARGSDFPMLYGLNLDENKIEDFTGAELLTSLTSLSFQIKAGFTITTKNFPLKIRSLQFEGKSLSGAHILTNLQELLLSNLEECVINAHYLPQTLGYLKIRESKLTSIVGVQSLKNLKGLDLSGNELEGEFVVSSDTFPSTIEYLHLSRNRLTGFVGAKFLTNLRRLDLDDNHFEGVLNVTEEVIPLNLSYLNLGGNKLTGIANAQLLMNLSRLDLSRNQFEGEFIITADNFPGKVLSLDLSDNEGLKSITLDDTSNALLLKTLTLKNMEDLVVNKEICNRLSTFPMPEICRV